MNKKIRKMLIIQLSIIEVILLILLIDVKQTSCITETENDILLVYNYNSNALLSPKIVKEEVELTTNKIDEESEDETSIDEEEEIIEEEVKEDMIVETQPVVVEQPVVETPVTPAPQPEPVVIRDVNYSVAQNLVEYAKQFVGYPYVYGGNSLTNGTDCSGFTKLIYAQYGVNLPRTAYDQAFVGYEVPISQIQIGDLVLSGYGGTTHHVAIYIGGNQLVHALNSNVGIVITDLYIMPITHIRRVL